MHPKPIVTTGLKLNFRTDLIFVECLKFIFFGHTIDIMINNVDNSILTHIDKHSDLVFSDSMIHMKNEHYLYDEEKLNSELDFLKQLNDKLAEVDASLFCPLEQKINK